MVTLMVLLNLAIAFGYVMAALTSVPGANPILWRKLGVQNTSTRVAGFTFFVTCAATHVELALHAASGEGLPLSEMVSFHMFVIHGVQVIAVAVFLRGVWCEILNRDVLVQHRSSRGA